MENQPCTGAYYRNVLEDLQQRADTVGQELQALSSLSLDAVSIEVRKAAAAADCRRLSHAGRVTGVHLHPSPVWPAAACLQELVGHSVALYCQNYEQVRAPAPICALCLGAVCRFTAVQGVPTHVCQHPQRSVSPHFAGPADPAAGGHPGAVWLP